MLLPPWPTQQILISYIWSSMNVVLVLMPMGDEFLAGSNDDTSRLFPKIDGLTLFPESKKTTSIASQNPPKERNNCGRTNLIPCLLFTNNSASVTSLFSSKDGKKLTVGGHVPGTCPPNAMAFTPLLQRRYIYQGTLFKNTCNCITKRKMVLTILLQAPTRSQILPMIPP